MSYPFVCGVGGGSVEIDQNSNPNSFIHQLCLLEKVAQPLKVRSTYLFRKARNLPQLTKLKSRLAALAVDVAPVLSCPYQLSHVPQNCDF